MVVLQRGEQPHYATKEEVGVVGREVVVKLVNSATNELKSVHFTDVKIQVQRIKRIKDAH